MAHLVLVDGTSYEISGGKTLVDGTAYSVDNGKTLIGGTAYDIAFDDGMRTVRLAPSTNGSDANYAKVTIEGKEYSPTESVELRVPVGTIIHCWATSDPNARVAYVTIEYVRVAEGRPVTYDYTVTSDVRVGFGYLVMFGSVSCSLDISPI